MFARIGLIGLLLLVSVPFVLPWRTSPIPSFHTEWWALACGLMTGVALLVRRGAALPGVSVLCLALAAVALAQWGSGHAAVPQLALLHVLFLLWAALLASAAGQLTTQWGQERLALWLAMALLGGAVLAALSSLLQPWLLTLGWPGYSVRQGGPLGQANHFTSHLWIGLASALYLRTSGRLDQAPFWGIALLLTVTVVLIGQRSSFLYAAILIGLALWQARGAGEAAAACRRHAFVIGALFLALQPLSALAPSLGAGELNPPPAMRVSQMASQPSVRLQLWKVGALGVADAPWLGKGIGGYPALALEFADQLTPGDNPGPAESAHNLFIDLAVELGLPVALLVFGVMLVWIWRQLRAGPSAARGWGLSVVAILGMHALLEYPLSHAYFLGLLVVAVAVFDTSIQTFRFRLAPLVVGGLIAWGGLMMHQVKRDYGLLELALATGKKPEMLDLSRSALLHIPGDSLLAPWVSTTACVSLDPLQVPVKDGLAVCRVAMYFAPTVESGVNTVVLLWRVGNLEAAEGALRRLRLATAYHSGGADRLVAGYAARVTRLIELSRP